eukprot:CAMPEP_0196575138 /NCGR_PEP_ID=MMETSP1081-20130531/4681_1 /TAXON_ID=36882 /ORGANISM="Pyramimonas amylifera, Strain CCMP720" /LENGTH=166 /DNA_ID=CAMNT_0041893341 /DNA_START=284 /DNA_END=784 /DNA_ORIENTATION=+
MYVKSAAAGPQATALLEASRKWGVGVQGHEEIPFSVCKRKYQPLKVNKVISSGAPATSAPPQRLYGCHFHSDIRERLIKRYGPRSGWEDFSFWHNNIVSNKVESSLRTLTSVGPSPAVSQSRKRRGKQTVYESGSDNEACLRMSKETDLDSKSAIGKAKRPHVGTK